LAAADLLIIMGTSLRVRPFCSLVDMVPATCPRLLLNKSVGLCGK
jgi:NAD-dependent SIR2 family protein deacetylase